MTEAESTNSSLQESDGNDSARGSSSDDPKAKIQFQIDENDSVTDSASDSANSEEISQFYPAGSEYNRLLSSLNTYKLEPLHENGHLEASPASPYRSVIIIYKFYSIAITYVIFLNFESNLNLSVKKLFFIMFVINAEKLHFSNATYWSTSCLLGWLLWRF